MGTFAMAEAILMVLRGDNDKFQGVTRGSMKLDRQEVKTLSPVVGRSSLLGFFIGILPGAGATIASFLAYGMEKYFTRDGPQFGTGNIKGLAAPETANNAACTGSFVPLLTLGIPGSGTTAILLGALIAYGIQPSPRLFVDQPGIFWAVIASMYIGNLFLLAS